MANESMISLNVNLGSTKNVEAKLNELITKLETKKIKLEIDTGSMKASLDAAVKGLSGVYEAASNQAKKAKEETDGLAKSLNFLYKPSLIEGFNFDKFTSAFKQVKGEALELQSIVTNYGKKKNGNGAGALDSVMLQYTNNLGKTVIETMAWAEKFDKAGNSIGMQWQNISTKILSNEQALKQLQSGTDNVVSNMKTKLEKITIGKEFVKDLPAFKTLQDTINNFNPKNLVELAQQGKDVSSMMKQLNLEVDKVKVGDKISSEYSRAQKSLESFKNSMSKKINLIEVGKDGGMVNQLQVFDQLKTKLAELQNFKLTTSNVSEYIEKAKEINSLYDQTQVKIKAVNSAQAEMNKTTTIDSNVTNKIKDLNAQLDIMLMRNSALASNPAFQKLRQDVESLKTVPVTEFNNNVKDITRNMSTLRAETTASTGVFGKLGQSIKSAFSFMSASMVFYQLANQIREIPNLVKEVDTSFVELQKVSQVTANQFDEVINNAYKKGNELSATLTDYIGAMASINRGGYSSDEDINTLSKLSIVMKNVSENMKDTDDNATALIATIKGFNGEVSDAEHYVNAYNNVSNNMSVTFDQLVNGVEKASAVLNIYGNDFNDVIAMITGGTEIFGGDSERVANGLKSIGMNLAGIDEATNNFDIEYFSKMEDTLKEVAGIDITETNGDLKSTYEILDSLAEVYPTLEKNQQLYLTQLIGKKTQSTVLAAILQNWEAVEKAQELAIDSAGSYADEQAKYYESIQGYVDRLASAFQKLSVTTLDSGFVKQVLQLTTNFVNMIDAAGGLVPVLASVVVSMTALKVISASQSLTFGGLIQGAKSLITSMFTVKTATDAATVSTLALSAAEKTLVVGAIVASVMAIGTGIHYIATSSERAAQKVLDLSDELSKIKESSTTLKGLADEFEKLYKKGELNSDESKRFYEVQNQIKELQPEISGYYDEQGNFIITQVSSAQELLDIQKEILKAKKEELRDEQEDILDDNIKKYEKQKQLIEDIARYSELASKGKKLSASEGMEISSLSNKITMSGGSVSDLDGTIKDIKSEMFEASNEIHDYLINSLTLDDSWDTLGESMKNGIRKTLSEMDAEEINNFSSKIKDGSLSISDFIGEMSKISTPVETTVNALGDVSDTSSETGESVKSLSERASESANNLDILKVALDELKNIQDISGTTLDKLIKKYPELEDELTSVSNATEVLNKKILEQNFDEATNKIADLTTILEDLQAGNGITSSSFKKISENFPELLGYMNDEKSLIDAITDKTKDYKNEQNQAYEEMLRNSEEYYNKNILANEQMSNSILKNTQQLFNNLGVAYNGDLSNWKSLAQGKATVEEQLINQLNKAWETHFGNLRTAFAKTTSGSIVEKATFDRDSFAKQNLLMDNNFSSDKGIIDMAEKAFYQQEAEWTQEQIKRQKAMSEIANLFNDIKFDAVDIKVGGTKSSGSSKSSSEKYAEYIDSIYDSILNSLQEGTDKVDRQIAISQSKLENLELFGTQEDVTNATSDIEKLYQDRIDIMKKSSSDMVSLRNKMAKELQATDYTEIKGLDLTNISQLGVDKIISNLEQQIDSANNKDNAKLAASLTYKKNLIEDYTGNIINANSEINSMSKDIIDAQNELANTVIDNINRVLDNTISKANSTLGQIDLEKMLLDTDGNSDAAKADAQKLVELNKQALTEIVAQRKATEDAIKKLRVQGIKDESDEIQTLLDQWRGYESSRLTMIKEMAEARRKASIDSAQDEMDGTQDALDDSKSLLDLTVNMLKKETEAKKDALKEQTDDRKEALEEQYEADKKALDDKLDLLKKEANAQKDALKEEQDERNYNDEVSEKQKQIANTQSKITELSLDDSVSAQKKRKTLEEELDGYKKELADLQYNRSVELQTNAIDKELEAQEDKISAELEALEEQYNEEVDLIEEKYDKQIKEYEDYLSKESKLRQDANDLIASKDKAFYEKLKAYATEYSGLVSSEFEDLWSSAYDGMEKYGNGQLDVISNIESMTNRIISLRKEIETLNNTSYKNFIEDDSSTSDDDYKVSNGSSSSGSSSSGGKYDGLESKDERAEYRDKQLEKLISYGDQMKGLTDTNAIQRLKDKQAEVAQTIGAYLQNGTYYIMINNKKYPVRSAVGVRHNGGFMDESSVKLKSNEMFGKLLKNEFVVNEGQMDRFMTKTLPSITNYSSGKSSGVSVVLDMHDFSVTQDSLPDFKKLLKTEIPKVLNDTLFKKAIK